MPDTIRIKTLKAEAPSILHITWTDGRRDHIDLAGIIATFEPFAPLADLALFIQAAPDDWGDAVEWPNGLDYGANSLRRVADLQRPLRKGEFRRMVTKTMNITASEAATMLGLTDRTIRNYFENEHKIPAALVTLVREMLQDKTLFQALYRPGRRRGRPLKKNHAA